MELAVEEINNAGGVLGRKLELITRDDNANPGDAVRVTAIDDYIAHHNTNPKPFIWTKSAATSCKKSFASTVT